jgi:hypothetical protein
MAMFLNPLSKVGQNLLFNPFSVNVLSTMDGNSTLALVARDTFENVSRVEKAGELSPLAKLDQTISQWGTSVVWGFGVPLMGLVADKIGKHGLNKPFLNTDTDLLSSTEHQGYVQQWVNELKDSGQSLPKHLTEKAKDLEGLFHLNAAGDEKLLQAAAKTYGNLSFSKELFRGLLPALMVGVGLTELIHAIDYRNAQNEKSQNKEAPKQTDTESNTDPTAMNALLPFKRSNVTSGSVKTATTESAPIIPALSAGLGAPSSWAQNPSQFYAQQLSIPNLPPRGAMALSSESPNATNPARMASAFSTNALPSTPASSQNVLGSTWLPSTAPSLQPNSVSWASNTTSNTSITAPAKGPIPTQGFSGLSSVATEQLATGGGGSPIQSLVNAFKGNDMLTNLCLVDAPGISAPRILDTRSNAERAYYGVQELMMVYMMYFGAQQLNGAIKGQGIQKLSPFKESFGLKGFDGARELLEFDFPIFQKLNTQYLQGDTTQGFHQFKTDLKAAFEQLGVPGATQPSSDFEGFAKTLANQKDTLETNLKQMLKPGQYQAGSNLIVELAADAGMLPVWREREGLLANLPGKGANNIVAYNPTQSFSLADLAESAPDKRNALQKLGGYYQETLGLRSTPSSVAHDTDTIQALMHRLNKLYHLAEESGPQNFKKIIHNTMGAKSMALGASLGMSYFILANLMPELQNRVVRDIFHEDPKTWAEAKYLQADEKTNPKQKIPTPANGVVPFNRSVAMA